MKVWFWQLAVSPHIVAFAEGLVAIGCEVKFFATEIVAKERVQQGWSRPQTQGFEVQLLESMEKIKKMIEGADPEVIHVCQGLRGNGVVGQVVRALVGQEKNVWIMLEKIDDSGLAGLVKRLAYRLLIRRVSKKVQGFLTIGHSTGQWLVARGAPEDRVFEFAYFLPAGRSLGRAIGDRESIFRFIFVGQFIERKRLDLLLGILGKFPRGSISLSVVGSGPMEEELKAKAVNELGESVKWLGRLPIETVPNAIKDADCLVLPSRHDGWGAVVSEALLVGTPVVCSEACGSAGVVKASGKGAVFKTDDADSLLRALTDVWNKGPINESERLELTRWARSLTGRAGAEYFSDLVRYSRKGGVRPFVPWRMAERA